MKHELKPHQLTLLQEIVASRCPTLISRFQTPNPKDLNREERRLIINALADEFGTSGITTSSEPNQRGLQIEEIIDFVNRPNLTE